VPDRFRDSSVLHVQDLYQGFGDRIVLDNLDLSVQAGEFVTVVGPSGCGKSSLLRIIIGQDRPLSGEILVEGRVFTAPSTDRGVVYQHYSLFPHLSALENVLVGRRLSLWPWQWPARRKDYVEEAMAVLEKADMAGHADKLPHQLSGGQRQRIAIGQALIQKPTILCMDEPFSALDPGTRESMQLFLLEMWEEFEMTIFFVTHDLEEAVYLGTRLVALSQYYTDDRDEIPADRGAKIVLDQPLRRMGTAAGPSAKATADFGEMVQGIRLQAFDPEYRQHVRDFELTHPQSWATLTPHEDGGG
jgi:NitT/TauT family transport system ATP-binding protein